SVKYNGDTWFSHEQSGIQEAFTNATKFKSASFKSITATLTAAQKNQAVQLLMDLEIESHAGRKVDWNTNDFDLADSIRHMADHFIGALTTLGDTVDGFESLFPTVADQKQTLLSYGGKVTESNYIEKVEYLLTNSDQFSSAIQTILKAQKFIKKNFSKVREFKRFIEEVVSELKKADRTDNTIREANEEFNRLYKQDMVKNFGSLQQQVQIVKDSYYKLIKNAAAGMSHEYQLLSGKVDAALRTLKSYPAELNTQNQKKLDELKRYCSDRVIKEPVLEYAISCKNCGYSLSDILNYTALAPTKDNELLILQSGFIAEAPKPEPDTGGGSPDQPSAPKKPRKIRFQVTSKIMTVQEYKSLLTAQLTSLAAARPDEEIELDIETL
ncbi:MAG: BREX system P-loop protein BrxC, partial [Gammaproteobacteria bacterium]|nr:BREX system P-loop protein BrxC [Gammaproteobacteria bacterium]